MRLTIIAGIAVTGGTVLSATQSATFRKATDIVPVHVTVRTNGGEIVRGLTVKDFDVFDNGSRREIVTFSSEPVPVSVAILLDCSGSLDQYARQVARAGDAFLDHLLPGDRVSVQTLAADCQPLTTDFSLVRSAIAAGLPSDPGSPIWAGLDRTVSLFPDTTSRRAVLLVTDGENDSAEGLLRQTNSASRPLGRCRYATPVTPFAITADGAAQHIERDGALVYAIGISEGRQLFGSTLARIASRSGGRLYGADNLAAAFTDIADELHLQYLLGFPAATADSKAHEIDVRVKRPAWSSVLERPTSPATRPRPRHPPTPLATARQARLCRIRHRQRFSATRRSLTRWRTRIAIARERRVCSRSSRRRRIGRRQCRRQRQRSSCFEARAPGLPTPHVRRRSLDCRSPRPTSSRICVFVSSRCRWCSSFRTLRR